MLRRQVQVRRQHSGKGREREKRKGEDAPVLRLRVDQLLDAVLLLKLLLRNQVIIVDQLNLGQPLDALLVLGARKPRHLLLRLLEVSRQVKLHLDRLNVPGRGALDRTDKGVSPVHEGHFFVLSERRRVGLLDEEFVGVVGRLVTDFGVLLVLRNGLGGRLAGGGLAFA